jgi:hypothetical protein
MAPDEPAPPADASGAPPAPQPPAHRGLRRAAGLLVAVVIGLVAVVGLIVFFNSRDDAGVDQAAETGPVPAQTVTGTQLGARQDELLRLGDVIVVYGGSRRPPAALVALRDRLSGPPDPVLTQAGQAVVLEPRSGAEGIEAHVWRRVLRVQDPADPALETFASYWLGRGAG